MTMDLPLSNGNGHSLHSAEEVTPAFKPWPWHRLIRFVAEDGRELLGEPVDQVLDVGLAHAKGVPVLAHVLSAKNPWDLEATRTGERILVDKAGTIRATGLNYTDHAIELGMGIPTVPAVFFKPSSCLAGPGEEIPIPRCAQNEEMDYEVELAVVIGRTCRDVNVEEAMGHVLGWTCANDLTARKVQNRSTQWGYSKGFDKFCPLGPCIVSTSALPDPGDVTLQTRVNGELVQSGSAQNMIWHVSQIVSFLSVGTTLLPGTVIITGTPSGIGSSRGQWLRNGDEVRCSISHGIGTMLNTIVYSY